MNKYKLFFRLAKEWLKVVWIFGVIYIGGLYAMFVFVDNPNFFITSAYSSMAMMIRIILRVICRFCCLTSC